MKRVFLLIVIAIAAFLLVVLYKNSGLLNDIWIWLVGLAGLVIKSGRSAIDYFKQLFSDSEESALVLPTPVTGALTPAGSGTYQADVTITVLRYMHDDTTTVGLLYIENTFQCYTLEDTYHQVKVPGDTRVPAGIYQVGFSKEETSLTKKYRDLYPDWFTYHIEIMNVPEFSSIYIHNGGDYRDTEGCLLVSDSLSAGSSSTVLTNSKNTFKRIYQKLEGFLHDQKSISIIIRDESWVRQLSSGNERKD